MGKRETTTTKRNHSWTAGVMSRVLYLAALALLLSAAGCDCAGRVPGDPADAGNGNGNGDGGNTFIDGGGLADADTTTDGQSNSADARPVNGTGSQRLCPRHVRGVHRSARRRRGHGRRPG